MRIRNLTYELKRPVPLALASLAAIVLVVEGQAAAIVIRTGGFLGLGGKLVALPFDQVLWNTGDVSSAPIPSRAAGESTGFYAVGRSGV